MTFADKICSLFRREAKKDQVNAHNGLLATPTPLKMVASIVPKTPQPTLGEFEHTIELPAIPKRAFIRENTLSKTSIQSLMAYGQTELAGIDAIPRPHWAGPGLSDGNIHDIQTHIKTYYRYETLEKRGIKAPTILVGPSRRNALEAYEKLEERTLDGVKALLKPTQAKIKEDGKTGVKDEGSQIKIEYVVEGCRSPSRRREPHIKPPPQPAGAPVSMGYRRWLREGVEHGAEPHAVSPRFYGRDKENCMIRTVFPRDWGTTLVTTVERPRAVPREYYQQFSREM
ncbi:hypothetical protein TWF718_010294 [Orbilia javanica]|uniref:Uncharacterized protein n=1 Tax=Orbilia javanica TaxID=47235 RepID=A0AAN8MQG5_9PEZI